MGQYQGRSVSKSDVRADLDDQGLREAAPRSGERLSSCEIEPAPPVFGSPIDNESFLASLGGTIPGGMPKAPLVNDVDLEPGSSVDKEEEENEKHTIPIVFRWDGGGNEVYICGSFNNWESKIPMTNSQSDFTAIVDLPEGRHEYKFFIDGQWLHDPNEDASDNGLGSYNNVFNVTKKDFDAYFETWELMSSEKEVSSSSPPGSYTQLAPSRSATSGLPPHLPPLLQQTVLNQEQPSLEDPTLLPDPNHVIVNHLYALSIKDHVLVLAATHRYQQKYVTTLMYKPV